MQKGSANATLLSWVFRKNQKWKILLPLAQTSVTPLGAEEQTRVWAAADKVVSCGGAPLAFVDAVEGEEGQVGTAWPWGALLPTNGQCLP